MKDFVEFVVKNLVTHPDEVSVSMLDEGNCKVIKVKVSAEDMGKVVGKNGRVANSIRTVVRSVARKTGDHYVIKFNEKM